MSQVVLITGASSGIGYATAQKLLSLGCVVYGGARHVEKMKPLRELGITVLKLDVTNEKQLQSTVNRIIKEQGKIDVLFNNAGYGLFGSIEEIPLSEARAQFEVNLFGMARLTQLVLPHMRHAGSGKIINTSSIGGKMYTPFGAWYHATKHAIEGWSDCLRFELRQFNIDVVIIEPGAIRTGFSTSMLKLMKKYSSSGPYKKMFDSMMSTMAAGQDNQDAASPPSVIADVVAQAISAKKPKTRYPAGKMARPMLFLRKILSDRTFDKLLTHYVKE